MGRLNSKQTTPEVQINFIKTLTRRLKRGEYVNAIPERFWRKFISRSSKSKEWQLMTGAEKGNYLALQIILTQDSRDKDYHVGDENFRNRIYGSVNDYISLGKELLSEEYLTDDTIEFPKWFLKYQYVSSSNFSYGKYISESLHAYLDNPSHTGSRSRRYSEGKPLKMPIHPEAKERFFKMFDCWVVGMKWLREQDEEEQERLMLAAMPFGTNMGYPKFYKGTENNLPVDLLDFMTRTGFKVDTAKHSTKDRKLITVKLLRQFRAYLISQKIYPPYIGFSRTSRDKIRFIAGAHLLGKWEAGMIKVCFEYSNYNYKHPDSYLDYSGKEFDPATGKPKIAITSEIVMEAAKNATAKELNAEIANIVTSQNEKGVDANAPYDKKQLFGFGGLPLVAKLPWDDMFKMIIKRLPDRTCKVHVKWVEELFHFKVPMHLRIPGTDYTYVNILCGDFSGFDTGQIPEEYEDLKSHKFWGSFFKDTLDDITNSAVWAGIVEFLEIFFKSGFWATSDFGSFFHHGTTTTAIKNLGGEVIAHICLSDDDMLWVCSSRIISASQLSAEYAKYGHTIKASASHDWFNNPVLSFLKMHVGYIFKDKQIALLGDLQSRLYGILHSERNTTDKTSSDLRSIWVITGDVEVDRVISKLGSGGPAYKPWVLLLLRAMKGTDLGDRVRLAIDREPKGKVYRTYREDLDVTSYPPNWVFDLNVDLSAAVAMGLA